ncbi:CaiB/BaiF CoA transferase family protein [Paraburkholderia sp. ZP32-5]|uniref:CaiB/BaiF CoA transferase family protein n=1 Tax=Paraburkholderia sp. ZP32-5 TaxID=2883245 RepID=UPI001F4606C0|nr:CaiB/BaiF CoA-transferase family protein [Paraburkholderia sp. ZP32-5]
MAGPLNGVRVLDLTNVLSGPFCCHQLAHMGAEVIKIETPGSGDLARQLGADPQLNRAKMGVSFLAQNAGKQSVTINLKSEEGKEVFRRLVKTADVVVENYRPGVMQRLGFDFDTLKTLQPELVYCAISGFGQQGELRELPAYDQIIQGMSGVMSITGDEAAAPLRVGYPIADTIGGITAAFAIAAALARQPRREATFIDVSMLEATLATMGWAVSNYLIAGQQPKPMGNENITASPSGAFRTANGLLNIAANKQEQFEALCRVVGRPELIVDTRFSERQARLTHRFELKQELENALAAQSADAWWPLLTQAGIPSGPVLSVPDALDHPQISERGMIARFDDCPGVGRDIRVVRTGFKINGATPAVDAPPPRLSQDTQRVLTSLGFTQHEIDALRESGAI